MATRTAKPKDTGSGKPRHEKLALKDGARVAKVGNHDAGVDDDVKRAGGKVVRSVEGADVILVALETVADLPRITETRTRMSDESAIWAVWVKGKQELNEHHVRATALAMDLVDVKGMSWSATHTALKLVVRKALRKKA